MFSPALASATLLATQKQRRRDLHLDLKRREREEDEWIDSNSSSNPLDVVDAREVIWLRERNKRAGEGQDGERMGERDESAGNDKGTERERRERTR